MKGMALLHKIELKYGSVVNAPDSDPMLIKLHKIYYIKKRKHNGNGLTKDEINAIILHIRQGYPMKTTCRLCHISTTGYSNIKHRYGLSTIPLFNYVASKAGKKDIWFTSMKVLNQVLNMPCNISYKRAAQLALKEDIIITSKRCIWKNIPDGDYYVARDGSLHVKHGIDSFLALRHNN